jgi:hypothetical protein
MVVVKRGIVLIGCAMAFASGSLVVATPAGACPYGTSERFPGVCTNGTSARGGGIPQAVVPPPASPPGATVVQNPNGYSSVNGIPCTPENYGKCIALQQSQG